MKFLLEKKWILAFLAGASTVFSFAPFHLFPLSLAALSLLFGFWLQEEHPRRAAWIGFAFGFGTFAAGVGWIYVALHDYGDMNFLLAALATALFAAFLALFPASVGYVQARLRRRFSLGLPSPVVLAVLLPALWTAAEWVRGLIFTGFPWLSVGYSQAAMSPLAGYAPVFGVFGVSLAVSVSAGLLALLVVARWNRSGKLALVALLVLWGGGAGLRTIEWTQPQGSPLKVSLLQGNIPEELKFDQEKLVDTLETYRRLILGSDARLIVLPETAIPMMRDALPENYAAMIREHARAHGGDVLVGGFERERGLFYNSVYSLGASESQSYRKNHLVPFGEFIPLRPVLGWLINDVLNIPMGDQARGGSNQLPLHVAGQKVAMDICYEDVFGEEIIRALPEATLLVNVTNDAWYGNSNAAVQHNQISQMRALETGRMMLRATNTGVTSVIDRTGTVVNMLPQHEEGILTVEVQGYAGSTPYVRLGNVLVLGLIAGMVAVAWWRGRRL